MACIAYEEMAPRQCATRGVGGVGDGTGARAFNRQGVVSGDEGQTGRGACRGREGRRPCKQSRSHQQISQTHKLHLS